jgi:WD40 repeat protein
MFGLTRSKTNRLRPTWSGAIDDHAIAVGWSADGKTVAAAASTGSVRLFDAKTGSGIRDLSGHPGGTLGLSWSPKSNQIATAGKDSRVRLWDTSGQEIAVLEASGKWVDRLAWHTDGSLIAASSGRTVFVWTEQGEKVTELTDHASTVSDLAWRPHSNTIGTLAYGGVMLWTLGSGQVTTFKQLPWKGSPLAMAWSPDGSMLVHGNQDSTVHFWYVDKADELQMWGYPTKIRELSWDRTGRYLATGGGENVCVWDCGGKGPAGSKPQLLEGHVGTISAVAFQRRGTLIASSADDGRICLWNPKVKAKPQIGVIANEGEATCLAWSPDDSSVVCAYSTGLVGVARVE